MAGRGATAGDGLLREAALAWAQQLRGTDLPARHGDDELAAAFPGCPLGPAVQLAERLRTLAPDPCTVSVGVACRDGEEPAARLFERALAALADAKHAGGDRVVAAPTTPG